MATRNGLEPSTSSVTGWRANRLHHRAKYGGNNRARTCDPMLVRHVLSQLSYAPLPQRCAYKLNARVIIHRQGSFVKCFFHFFRRNFPSDKLPCKYFLIIGKSHLFQEFFQILRRKFIDRVAELALHRERFFLGDDVLQFLPTQADQSGGHPLPGAIAPVVDLRGF